MKKIVLILFLTVVGTHFVAAQEDGVTSRHELFVGYGAVPTTDFFGLYSNMLSRLVSFGPVSQENSRSFGAVNVGYLYYVKPWFGVGAIYSYANLKQDVVSEGMKIGVEKYGYHNIMPSAKFNWLRRPIVTLYSRVAAGVTITPQQYTDAKTGLTSKTTDAMFAFQVSPVGVEVGRAFAGFAEVGIGNMGVVQVGLRYRF